MSTPSDFSARVVESRAKHLSPAIGVVWVGPDGVIQTAAHGQLAPGNTASHLWHIGSCTKAMTATLFARLVDQGLIGFETTLADTFPALANQMSSGFRSTSLNSVLTHQAGIARNPAKSTFRALRRSTAPIAAQRRFLVTEGLREAPRPDVGYSNLGYIILGAAIEAVTGRTWEAALAREVMIPLGIARFGFGAPGTGQLFGHRREEETWLPEHGDNPIPYGPAGRVHLSLDEWGRFLRAHLSNGPFLTDASRARLYDRAENGFGMGWIPKGDRLFHTGSNTAWFAEAVLVPAQGVGVGIVCNCFDKRIAVAVDDLANDLLSPYPSTAP